MLYSGALTSPHRVRKIKIPYIIIILKKKKSIYCCCYDYGIVSNKLLTNILTRNIKKIIIIVMRRNRKLEIV